MNKSPHEELPLFMHWMEFLPRLFSTTAKFPKNMRFALTTRIDNLALDILEKIVEAFYKKKREEVLLEMDLSLEKMRVMMRVAHDLKFLGHKSYEHAQRQIREAGKQVGGWRKKEAGQ